MKIRPLILAVVLAAAASFVGLWTSAPAAQACTCQAETVEDLAEASVAIVDGVITGTRGDGVDTWYEAGIRTTWKGSPRLSVEFQAGSRCGSMALEEGSDSIFFLRGVEGGPYYAYICGFSGSDDEVRDELKELGHEGVVLSPPVATASGSASAPAPPEPISTPTAIPQDAEDPTAVPLWVYAPLAFGILITIVLVAVFSRSRG